MNRPDPAFFLALVRSRIAFAAYSRARVRYMRSRKLKDHESFLRASHTLAQADDNLARFGAMQGPWITW